MSLLSADMIETVVDDDGHRHVLVLDSGYTELIPESEIFNEKKYTKEERRILYNVLHNPSWPIPKKFNDFQAYGPKTKNDLSKLHGRLCRYLRNYVWFSDENSYELVANWIISTYFRKDFRFAPILIFDGVTQSGKSTVLKTLLQVVYRGMHTANYSAASLARQIEVDDVTLLLDESVDTLQTERGLEVCTLLKSCFEDGNVWTRADPKSMKVYRYHVYTHVAVAVKAEGLPEDVYNRGIRIGMVGMPDDLELGDIDSIHEDDVYGDCSPVELRTELYALRWACMGGVSVDSVPVDWKHFRQLARGHFTTKIDEGTWKGQWYYGYTNNITRAPRIHGRSRNIASTLYSIGICTLSEKPTIEMIIESMDANREVIIDTPEALTFSAMVDVFFRKVEELAGIDRVNGLITPDVFDRVMENISTTDVAMQFNRILSDQGNAGREAVPTKTITSKILALGFRYERGTQNRSYFDPQERNFKTMFMRYLAMWRREYVDSFDFGDLMEVNKR